MENLEVHKRLSRLEDNLRLLEELREALSPEVLEKDLKSQWLIRYGLFECIQIVIDIACHLVSKYNLGTPSSYSECIELLRRYDYINDALEDKLIGMIGLRNRLIHEYLIIEPKRLFKFLAFLDDFREFAKAIGPYF